MTDDRRTDLVEEFATRVLDDHLLVGPRPGQCRCGWGLAVVDLGRRHSAHVAHELHVVGLLRNLADD